MCAVPQEVIHGVLLEFATNNNEAQLLEGLRILRNLCARGAHYQEELATHQDLNALLHTLLFANSKSSSTMLGKVQTMAWQLLANTTVNNLIAQTAVWAQHGLDIVRHCTCHPLSQSTDVQLMILYNIFQGKLKLLTDQQALETVVRVWQCILAEKSDINLDFLHFFFEDFLVKEARGTVRLYARLECGERIVFLDYLTNYLRHNNPNGAVQVFLLQYLSKEFKIKSDCILRQSTKQVEQIQPREAYALLRVIACASGSEQYAPIYASDHALFLNVSSLLRCLVAAGKETEKNIFTPMTKLEEVALTSNISHEFESEISFELKTLLVRCVANLLYHNKINQAYCLDTQLMPALFECTNMDARNPLMKEWSILAIQNACMDCPEIQQLIGNMTKQGEAHSDIVNELDLKMGSLRIQPSLE